jgi:hypothetical protein
MTDNPDKAAQDFIDSLADSFDNPHNKVYRFTPSIKAGRRYLAIKSDDGMIYHVQVDVERADNE